MIFFLLLNFLHNLKNNQLYLYGTAKIMSTMIKNHIQCGFKMGYSSRILTFLIFMLLFFFKLHMCLVSMLIKTEGQHQIKG